MNSERLRRYVVEELAFDPCVDASSIEVTVTNRIVSLIGRVHSVAEKSAVIDAVERLKGVRGVVVDIDVHPTTDLKIEDEVIVKRAKAVLAWHRTVPRHSITIAVKNGHATLSGIVDWRFQKLAVEEDIRRLACVTGIGNEIIIRSTSQKIDIKKSIKEAIRRLVDVHSSQISVAVDEEMGHVKLRGRVVDWQARNAVEDAAWMVAGVSAVDNLVRIC